MKILVDFDDVIFNTKRFKADLKEIFLRFGVSEILYEQTYYDPGDDRRIKMYDARKHIERILKFQHLDKERIFKSLDEFMRDTSGYVFSDTYSFIDALGKENIFVVSYGDVGFSKEKIESCGIGGYLDNIFVTDKLKAAIVSDIMGGSPDFHGEKVFFLDDRIEQIHDVKEKFPDIISMLVKRPEGRYQEMEREECCNFEVHNLKEAEEIIKSFNR